MLKIKKIAVTGGLSAGKTTVCRIFEELGAYVISADEVVHQLLSPGTDIGQQVISLLGSDVISGQEFDRKKIAAKVFSQPDLLLSLEKLIHPAVFHEIERKYQQAVREKKHPLFVAEVPLLFETSEQRQFDAVITVMADNELCKKRFVSQTRQSPDEFEKRMTRQMTPLEKAGQAHFTIDNNGDLPQLKNQVKTIYSQLTEEFDFR